MNEQDVEQIYTKPGILIWSNEHNAWWGPGEMGYTKNRAAAGRYYLTHAILVVHRANKFNKGDTPNELLVPDWGKST